MIVASPALRRLASASSSSSRLRSHGPSSLLSRHCGAAASSSSRFLLSASPYPHFLLPSSATAATQMRMASSTALPRLALFEAVARHDADALAVVHSLSGRSFTYGRLLGDVRRARNRLLEARGKSNGEDLDGERVALLVENSYDYVGEQSFELWLSSCLYLIYMSKTNTCFIHSRSALRPGRARNSRASVSRFPHPRARVCPQPQRGLTARLLSQVCLQGPAGPGRRANLQARPRGAAQAYRKCGCCCHTRRGSLGRQRRAGPSRPHAVYFRDDEQTGKKTMCFLIIDLEHHF